VCPEKRTCVQLGIDAAHDPVKGGGVQGLLQMESKPHRSQPSISATPLENHLVAADCEQATHTGKPLPGAQSLKTTNAE
jgi:hypothetical protein